MSKNEMIMLPREVVKRVMDALYYTATTKSKHPNQWKEEDAAMKELRAALEQPQVDQEPYLYYDPENGDTWTQEAINDGFRLPDGLIALYTK